MFKIRKEAETALFLLSRNGYEAYLVGGCVRDGILGRSFTDYDITTNALPTEIKEVFKEYKTLDVGIKHGTVTVIIDKLPIEITTYRIDGEYIDNRHPDKVEFSRNIKDDLSRRDFTMNAVCYNGEYVDLFGGMEDIRRGIIRCVGDPFKRFTEDALRILRALRFSACLGFEIEDNTSDAILSCISLLNNISGERIAAELKKLLCGQNAKGVIAKYSSVFEHLFSGSNYSSRSEYIEKCPFDFGVRLACVLIDNSLYKEALMKLKLDNKTINRVSLAIENYNAVFCDDPVFIKKYLNKNGLQNFVDVLALKKAHGTEVGYIEEKLNNIIEKNECYTIKMLDVKGSDLLSVGIKGKMLGEALEDALEKVIDGSLDNKKERIIEYIKERKTI